MHGSYESEQPPQRKSTENNNKSTDSGDNCVNDFVRKPIADTLHTFLGHIHQQHQLQQHADNLLAKNWLKSESVPSAGGISGIGGAGGGMAALGSLGATGLTAAAGLGGPAMNGLPNFFLPFSAAQIPFPNFLSQASLFHVKDSVWALRILNYYNTQNTQRMTKVKRRVIPRCHL